MAGVSVGTIVLYKLPEGRNKGESRPAIVVRMWSDRVVNLQVFTDASNDGYTSVDWKTSVDRGYNEGQWLERIEKY